MKNKMPKKTVGVLKESCSTESRVAVTPHSASTLVETGLQVIVASGAGIESGYSNEDYISIGAHIGKDNAFVIERSDVLVKIKIPSLTEIKKIPKNKTVFCFAHPCLAPEEIISIANKKINLIAYNFIKKNNKYPIVSAISKLAGKQAYSLGASLLAMKPLGKGVFLGGHANSSRSKAVVFGGGNAGLEFIKMARAAGSRVTLFDKDEDVIQKISDMFPDVQTMFPHKNLIKKEIRSADIIIGAIHNNGRTVAKMLSLNMVKTMEENSVILDLCIGHGGISEYSYKTDIINNYIKKDGIIYSGIENISSSIPRSSSNVISSSIMNYIIRHIVSSSKNIDDPYLMGAMITEDEEIMKYVENSDPKKTSYEKAISKLFEKKGESLSKSFQDENDFIDESEENEGLDEKEKEGGTGTSTFDELELKNILPRQKM